MDRDDFLVRLRVQPGTIYISQSRAVLAADRDGCIADARHGFFVHETRLLSRWRYLVDGEPPDAVACSNVRQHSWAGYYVTVPPGQQLPPPDTGTGQVPTSAEQTLELRVSRTVADALHEDVDLENFTLAPTRFTFAIEVDADFADLRERQTRLQKGTIDTEWREVGAGVWELVFRYRASHTFTAQGDHGTVAIDRRVHLRVERAGSPPRFSSGRLEFNVHLPPRATWHACLSALPVIDGRELSAIYPCYAVSTAAIDYDARRQIYVREATRFTIPQAKGLAPVVATALQRSVRDLAALRLYDLDHGRQAWVPAAGLPLYVALFGRDVLTAAWQSSLASTEMLQGVLPELVRWQGTREDDWRDEEPGRMLHEAHTGPLPSLNFNPFARYYGSITTSGFFPIVVAELWHWTGRKELVGPLIDPALKALQWLDTSCADRGGFYAYRTRSIQGVRNQAWKDSRDGIVDDEGALVDPPIATCEEQGFVYAAKQVFAEVLWWFGRRDLAMRFWREAADLRRRFLDAYWMDDRSFIALGLGPGDRPIRSIASNPGHCLASAILDKERARLTADRLLQPDLFSGWGVRTLSQAHPAYNPYSYHRGSVWPVEQGTFVFGFMRYGLHEHADRLARAIFESAALFDFCRLPELFSGHARTAEQPFPALYTQANAPQAWSASTVVLAIQALLGLYPYAPLNLLVVDPQLPEWLPELKLTNLDVGDGRVSLRFFRKADGRSDYEVTAHRGPLHVVRQPSPWSLTATAGERLVDLLKSLLP